MSERGSFVTEYIYCAVCLEAVKSVLLCKEKYLCSQMVAGWNDGERELPIIAGKCGGLHTGEELETFEYELIPALERLICHELRIAVLSDSGGSQIFVAKSKAVS